jgi:RNA polymerase sigma-70 factor (ECF subfamily)
MPTTSVSLLERLRQPSEQEAWDRFVELYTPLLFFWARHLGLQEADAADLVQDVCQILVRKLPQFTYNQQGRFRGWLHAILVNQWRRRTRKQGEEPLAEMADDHAIPDGVDVLIEKEYRQYLVGRALQVMKSDFQPTTWKACWEYVCLDRPAAEVASELGLTIKAVYLAKARVLRRLREELSGLWDGTDPD